MQVNRNPANTSQLRRANIDSVRSEKSSKDTALEPASVPKNNDPAKDGQVLQELADEASEAFISGRSPANDKKIAGGIFDSIKDHLNAATDTRAAELFEGVDTENPTLTTNEGGFNVNASQGPEDSTYINLGDGAEVFVITEPSGQQVAYRVENGELGERIPTDGRTDIGNNIYVSIDESPTGESEVNFRQGGSSFPNPFRPNPKMTLNSDNSMLTTKHHERSGRWDIFGSTEVNSFDIQSGEQLVTDGEADLDKMTPLQQFDYYADTPEGARILRIEGNHYDNAAEQRVLVARAQYARGEGGPELFHEFTPGRAELSGEELAAYDAAVEDMMNEIRDQGVYSAEGPDGPGINNSVDLEEPIDESMLYLMAASAVEAYGDNPEALEAIQGDINKWIISTDNADASNGGSSGWYRSSTGEVQFSIDRLISDLPKPDHHRNLIAHELAHSLDNSDGAIDGVPPGLTAEQTELFIAERERLYELAYPGEGNDSAVNNEDYTTDVVDNSGFRNYAFFNRKEFLAVVSETFLSSDENAEILREASPELYNLFREYYGRDDLPAAVRLPPTTGVAPGEWG